MLENMTRMGGCISRRTVVHTYLHLLFPEIVKHQDMSSPLKMGEGCWKNRVLAGATVAINSLFDIETIFQIN